ncbi:hypothetical protein [Paenibacillus glycanilyticus]|uniref:DUF2269 family protein n=1 Tax=Paenibacillus glycanilyticus TaxID=126569 RepID=A0ABQ6G8B1_9BACL|nr:hypothetical protein [Paenibacillus glycanilyticus]GLX67194.1 hypothetical protein MU1_15390 [Paenibacillus glycanilyticus]
MKKITLQQRRILLLLHILFAAIMFGVQVVFIILALTASVTDDPDVLHACYSIMHLLADSSVRASTIGTTVTGIALSMLTSWGLFRYYWVIAKEALTFVAILIGFIGLHEWTLRGISDHGSLTVHHTWLMVGITLQTLSIIIMYMLSVWKPGGKRKTPA